MSDPGAGFAWHAARISNPLWVILLPVYGAFVFEGTEDEAEEMRAHKARWEGEIAHKRPASITDFPEVSRCWNHRGFVRLSYYDRPGNPKWPYSPRFHCECGACVSP